MTGQILLVLSILAVTVVLFVTEMLRVDVIAILIMLILAWTKLITPGQAFSGLASNAVVSIIGVMIIGSGLEKSGITSKMVRPIINLSGPREGGIIAVISLAVGFLSAFIQNIGAAALFISPVTKISRRMKLSVSRLLMPMGFAAILGGTLTLVGSSPLIILNDLLKQSGEKEYMLFSVTPIGLSLLLGGIIYFVILGRFVLPVPVEEEPAKKSFQEDIIDTWGIPATIFGCRIGKGSTLAGKTCEEAGIWAKYRLNLLALKESEDVSYAPWRFTRFAEGQELVLLGRMEDVERMILDAGLERLETSKLVDMVTGHDTMGFAELIVPPKSPFAGRTVREVAIRRNYGIEPILMVSNEKESRGDISDIPMVSGTTLVVYGPWKNIRKLGDRHRLFLMTPQEGDAPSKVKPEVAFFSFLGTIGLVLSGAPLSLSLISGALSMVLLGVLTIDDAYRSVDWRTVFLLAGLIPLGIAMDVTGAVAFIASRVMDVMEGRPALWILVTMASLSTLFSLFMSNVAATVLLVPFAVTMGQAADISPRALALLVAVCASNSFLLPTHQVNALLMGPGGYHNRDYIRAGGIMTALFLIICVLMVYFFYT